MQEQENVPKQGLTVKRHFTVEGRHPFEDIKWKTVPVRISEGAKVAFEHPGFEAPESWTQNSIDIVAQKYSVRTGVPQADGSMGAETSVKQIVSRVARTFRKFGQNAGYFSTPQDAEAFEAELTFLLVTQRYAFNSPVWFNAGRYHEYGHVTSTDPESRNWRWDYTRNEAVRVENNYEFPQLSACFIQSVKDTIDGKKGIMDLVRAEAKLFKYGSGTGSNFSDIRGRGEPIKAGGTSSGVMSFLKILDANAGSVKSGGTTRRAAKMAMLDIDHPEIVEFITWKAREDKKARALIAAGYDSHYEGEAYQTVSGQNSNNSILLTEKFLEAARNDADWHLTWRTNNAVSKTLKARQLVQLIAESAWSCADPGVMFDGAIQKYHTCKADGPIRATNPCAEYCFLDDTSCNLGSINLMQYTDGKGNFLVQDFLHTVRLTIFAKDLVVQNGSFPTKEIAEGTTKYRTLGLGYCNVGGMLLAMGVPYDSPEGRAYVAAITSLMTAEAYDASTHLAQVLGAFPRYEANKDSMLDVMELHHDATNRLVQAGSPIPDELPGPKVFNHGGDVLAKLALDTWEKVIKDGTRHGFRNAQVVVIAPTGTIGFMMGADTTGIEPAYSLVSYKKLAGGGGMMIGLEVLPQALANLGYTASQVEAIGTYVAKEGTIVDAPHVKKEHYGIFATAVDPRGNELSWKSHLFMTAIVQPFLSGGVSKTINMPETVTVDDIKGAYSLAHRLGMKNTAIYRNNCKASQPMNVAKDSDKKVEAVAVAREPTEDEVKALIATKYPHLQRGYRKPVPQFSQFAVKRAFTLNGAKHHITLTFEKEDGKHRLMEVFWGAGNKSDQLYEMSNRLGEQWSKRLREGASPHDLASDHILDGGAAGGMSDHPVIKTSNSAVDFLWRHILVDVYGKQDFVNPEIWDAYMQRLDRPQWAYEQLNLMDAASQMTPERPEKTLVAFGAQVPVVAEKLQLRKSADSLRCPTCGASGMAIQVTGSCKTCKGCGHSFGGC